MQLLNERAEAQREALHWKPVQFSACHVETSNAFSFELTAVNITRSVRPLKHPASAIPCYFHQSIHRKLKQKLLADVRSFPNLTVNSATIITLFWGIEITVLA